MGQQAVEDQIASAEDRKGASKRARTPDELERESRRHALQQALDYIDAQINSL